MDKPTLEECLRDALATTFHRTVWCKDKNIESYPRIERPGVLSITNLYSVRPRRSTNVTKKDKYLRTGDFDLWLAELERVAVMFGFHEVYFGGVCNDFLPDVLARKGYVRVMDAGFLLPHYSKFFRIEEKIPA